MANTPFKIKKSAVLLPEAAPTLTLQGELAYDSSDDKVKVRGSSTTDSVVSEAKTQALSNKTVTSSTIDADLNTITNIENADIKAGAAIDASKIANGTVSNTEFQYLGNVTSDIQTQIDAKAAGAASSVDNTLPRFDGITGKILQGSGVVVDDANAVTGVTNFTVDSLNLNGATVSSVANPLILAPASAFNLVLSPSGGGFVDLTGTLDVTGQADVDNLRLDGNTLSSQDTNGNIVLDPNGTGIVDIQAPTTITGLANVDNLRLDDNTISSTNTNGNILLDPNGTGVVSVEGAPLRLPEIATPATPSSGYGNVYFKSDGFLYQQNDDGTETKVGAGSGGINYITNPDAESTTTGWATYADAASSRPTDGTGGSPNVTWTRTTSSPLRGVGSFLFTKDAANRQGQGVSSDITVSNADLARVLQISFDYEIASGTYSGGTSSTDSDLIVYMYRTTATGRLIEPSIIKLDGGVAGVKYSYRGEFQTDSDATGYRLIIHVATTSASAYTVKFDNVVIGPSQQVNGSITTSPVAYTPTLTSSGGGNITLNATGKTDPNGFWYRDGEYLVGQVSFRNGSGGAATGSAGSVLIGLPSGYVPNTAKMATAIASIRADGFATLGVTSDIEATAMIFSSTTLVLYYQGGTNLLQVSDLAASYIVSLTFRYPVVGWGATATLGQDADTRVVEARYSTNAGSNLNNITNYFIDFEDRASDSHGAVLGAGSGPVTTTNTGWRYIVPVAGRYSIDASVAFVLASAAWQGNISIFIDGVETFRETSSGTTGDFNSFTLSIARSLNLNASQRIEIVVYQSSGGTRGLSSNSFHNSICIERQSGSAQIAASEVVAARVRKSAGQNITAGGTVVTFNTIAGDTHGAWNTSNNTYTAPARGWYQINSAILGANVTAGTLMQLDLQVNSVSNATRFSFAGSSGEFTVIASEVIFLNSGDVVRTTISSADANYDLSGGLNGCAFSISRQGGIG